MQKHDSDRDRMSCSEHLAPASNLALGVEDQHSHPALATEQVWRRLSALSLLMGPRGIHAPAIIKNAFKRVDECTRRYASRWHSSKYGDKLLSNVRRSQHAPAAPNFAFVDDTSYGRLST